MSRRTIRISLNVPSINHAIHALEYEKRRLNRKKDEFFDRLGEKAEKRTLTMKWVTDWWSLKRMARACYSLSLAQVFLLTALKACALISGQDLIP